MQVTLVYLPGKNIYFSNDMVFIVAMGVFLLFLHSVSAKLCLLVEFNLALLFLRTFYSFLMCSYWLYSLSSSG